jgi:transcriptional regulator of acetoin/glycerol metabolism
MSSHTADASRFQYLPDRIWRARHAYFDEKQRPDDLVDPLLLNSWQRCESHGRSHADHVVFDPVERHARALLLERHRELLAHAATELDALAQALSDAGYAVLMTNAQGQVIAVAGALDRRSSPLQQAFRIGVNVSEAAIGTSAMSLAIAEQRLSRVLGPEHFFADNQLFHCCAAPVFGPDGALVATVDITRDTPGLDASAMLLTKACARKIEQRLFDTQGAFVKLALELGDTGGTARIAFDAEGRWVASSHAARQLIAPAPHLHDVQFEQVFEGSFSDFVSNARKGTGQVLLRLRGGIRLRGELLVGSAASSPRRDATPIAAGQATPQAAAPAKLPADIRRAVLALDAGIPVLITGPTGAGKEVTARSVHDHTRRAQGPFLPINCGALPAELIAAELFGYAPGAFTGAKRSGSIGKIEAANHGTVLLDEIGDMPLDLQAALLRVLDTGEVLPVGAHRAVRADVRFVCATHHDLRERVLAGRFREDLYYRLAGCIVNVPALRERSDFDAVVDSVCGQIGVDPLRLSAPLRCELAARPWPGNVRQLKHAIGLAAALTPAQAPLRLEDFPSTDILGDAVNEKKPLKAPSARHGEPAERGVRTWQVAQQSAIAEALAQTQGNVTAAAALLGIGRATLYRKLAKH